MSLELLFLLVLLITFPIVGTVVVFLVKKSIDQARCLDKVHLQILIPRKDSDADAKQDNSKDFKDYIGLMEQLLTAMSSLYSGKFMNKLRGQHTFSLEYIAYQNQLYFHMVVPRKYQGLVEKQVTSFFSDAVIEEVEEINLFEGGDLHYATECLTLGHNYIFPIKTHQKLESDPINNITNALSKLDEDESCMIQIMLRPTDNHWQKHASKHASHMQKHGHGGGGFSPLSLIKWFINFWKTDTKDDGKHEEKEGPSALESEEVKLIDEKSKKIGYDAIIRIMTVARDHHECEMQMKNILSSFEQFKSPDTNYFHDSHEHASARTVRNILYRTFSRPGWKKWKSMILNVEEISSLFHFPHSKYNLTPEIKWQKFKIVKAPDNIPKEGILLGHNIYRGKKVPIYMKAEDRMRHFYVVGQTGTGKTTILEAMARQDAKMGHGMAVMDPHGDFASGLLPHIPTESCWWCHILQSEWYGSPDGSESPRSTGCRRERIRRSRCDEDDDKTLRKWSIWSTNSGLLSQWCPYTHGIPSWWCTHGYSPSLYRWKFPMERRRTLQNKIVKSWWDYTYAAMGDREKKEMIPYFQAKFSGFITNELLRNIIGQTKSSFQVDDIMNTGKILLINLSKGILGDLNSKLLGMIFVTKIQGAAMARQKIDKELRKDFFFYMDEFQNFVTDSIESILSEARKYRLSLNVAHQYLSQLEQSDALTKSSVNLKNAIFGNVGSMMSYKVGAEDAENLEKEFAPNFSGGDLVNMDKFKGVMRLMIDGQVSRAFSLIPENIHLEKWDPKLMRAYMELSRLKYGREKEFVNREILFRIGAP
jgi:DNA polymerase III delta prime subunit